jgi:hypothetical protein
MSMVEIISEKTECSIAQSIIAKAIHSVPRLRMLINIEYNAGMAMSPSQPGPHSATADRPTLEAWQQAICN